MAETITFPLPPSGLFSSSFAIAEGKRKTPSELRAEQLKRFKSSSDEMLPPPLANSQHVPSLGLQKMEMPKASRFIETRVPDVYAATKPGDRPKLFPMKDKQKDVPSIQPHIWQQQTSGILAPQTVLDPSSSKAKWKNISESGSVHWKSVTKKEPNINERSIENRTENVGYSTFRNVAELSSSLPVSTAATTVDMDKALKGMAASKSFKLVRPNLTVSNTINDTVQDELMHSIKADKVPLDLSLKTSMRLISTKSFQWCHRLGIKNQLSGLQEFICSFTHFGDRKEELASSLSCDMDHTSGIREVAYWKALHSWVHPQSILPPTMLSALTSAAVRGGTSESAFLAKRQQCWEDSFRSLYYMFRNRLCDLFYFSTQQFLVMFINGGIGGRESNACSAYLTRSTRGLRGLLQEQDVSFSMPLCLDQVGKTTIEELLELTEFEKANPGQTRLVDSMAAVDNSIQSLLAFNGSKSVHGFYDFLLNNRSMIYSTTCTDVPVLLSPVPFQNASLILPEVSCKQMQLDTTAQFLKEHNGGLVCDEEASFKMVFALEIKGTLLPPWVVCRLCSVLQRFHSDNFEASFVTDNLSEGLNVAQQPSHVKATVDAGKENGSSQSELCILTQAAGLQLGVVKHLKLSNASYTASINII